jgi:hypothetical protein
MKKIFLLFIFLSIFSIVKAQIGIGFYPLSNIASIRWNPKMIVRDSSGTFFETNYKYHFELRSSFSYSHNSRNSNLVAQPELAFFHCFAGKANGPMLFTGAGAFLSVNHTHINNGGFFVPLLAEYAPRFNFTHNICFDLETDLLFTTNGITSSVKLRPLVSVAWIFSPPVARH